MSKLIILAFLVILTACVAPPPRMPTPYTQPMPTTLDLELIGAASRGDTPGVLALLQRGASINAQDERGRTAIMAATYGNHVETVRALVQAGADVNIRDTMLNNPFLYAGAEGYLDILKIIHAAGASTTLTNRFGGIAIIPASERGHTEVVEWLLKNTDINANHVNNLGWTALLEAIILSDGGPRQQQIVKLLIEHGADVDLADRDGVSPLRHARQRGYATIEQLLLAAGASE
jgi:ankyrin repeat protein